MSNNTHHSIDRLWTRLGWTLVLAFLPFVFFIRGGANVFGEDIASEALQITMAGWGVFGFSVGLCGLAILGLIYIKRLGNSHTKTPWPADTNHENKDRDSLVSGLFLLLYSVAPVVAIIVGMIRYTDSHLSLWNSTIPLAQSFLQSRVAAYTMGCSNQPCFRIHPDNGHEYILYLTDGVLILSAIASITLWSLWVYAIIMKAQQTS